MQRSGSKFLNLIVILFFFSLEAHAQVYAHRLAVADSLFRSKRYVESFEQYENVLKQKQYTPAMLLKMAYIQEGSNHIGKAMYYLNLYFIASNDKSALVKMEQMAAKFNLKGYDATDTDWFLTFYRDYYQQLTVGLATVLIFFISLIFYTKVKLKRRPIATSIFFLVFLAAFFIHINFGGSRNQAIVLQSNTYVMEGPSAGAPVADVIDEGNRVAIQGATDVWLKINWNGNEAYVKNNTVEPVHL